MMKQNQILINILDPDASCMAASTDLCVHLSTFHNSGIVDEHVTFLLLVYRNIRQILKRWFVLMQFLNQQPVY